MGQVLPGWLSAQELAEINNTTRAIGSLAQAYTKIGLGFVRPNAKTGVSLDVDAKCHHQCSYCYAANAPDFMKAGRTTNGIFYRPEQQWDAEHEELFRGFARSFRRIGEGHFLRLFAHSDFKPRHGRFWQRVLEICNEERVETVVFTKTRACVEALAGLATRVLISLDHAKRWGFNSPAWVSDKRIVDGYRQRFPSVRTVALVVDEQDIEAIEADFYLAHHGKMKHLPFDRRLNQKRVVELVGRDRACTPSHRCVGCPTKCTLNPQEKKADVPAMAP